MTTKTIAELVDELFKTHLHPHGREYTYQEVVKTMGGEFDPTYIGKLRRGKIPNPGRQTILLLCRFFNVPPSYFFPELQPGDANAAPEEDPLLLALRSSWLAPPVKQKIEELIRLLANPHAPGK